ncbi:MAG: hypothetical protein IPJ84_14050 [Bdellovibrionales bacterium]|nr:hypothetical protein [Bdellovibrionales bacterium]
MMTLFRISILIGIVLAIEPVLADEDVRAICEATGVDVLDLKYRSGDQNYDRIVGTSAPAGKLIEFVKAQNKKSRNIEAALVEAALNGNQRFVPASKLKTVFQKYSTRRQKESDPSGYRLTVLELIDQLVPKGLNRVRWFQSLKQPWVKSTAIRPVSHEESLSMYGAQVRTRPVSMGQFSIEVVFSNNDSEPLPFLIPLIVHEFQHVWTLKDRIKITDEKTKMSAQFVDEARAFDIQMQTYVAMAKNNPELFCNWIYVTWAYGDLLVPLSWTMSAMERELRDGSYLARYAKSGVYSGMGFLLNDTKDDLHPSIRAEIRSLNLKYVR